jgi:endonuclease-3
MTLSLDNLEQRQALYHAVAPTLEALHGRKDFKPHDGMDELVSCILSQNTTDANRDRAFFALKERYPTWADVQNAPTPELIEVVRPAGLANSKAPNIQACLEVIYRERGEYNIDFLATMPAQQARAWLMALPGVGPKTASIVLCFGYGMAAFPVDTHVFRVGKRIGFLPAKISIENAHYAMEAIVPASEYYPFHLQLIYHGRKICKARQPQCAVCPIKAHCHFYTSGSPSELEENADE